MGLKPGKRPDQILSAHKSLPIPTKEMQVKPTLTRPTKLPIQQSAGVMLTPNTLSLLELHNSSIMTEAQNSINIRIPLEAVRNSTRAQVNP